MVATLIGVTFVGITLVGIAPVDITLPRTSASRTTGTAGAGAGGRAAVSVGGAAFFFREVVVPSVLRAMQYSLQTVNSSSGFAQRSNDMRRYCDLQVSNNPCVYYIAGACGIVQIGIEKASACHNYRSYLMRAWRRICVANGVNRNSRTASTVVTCRMFTGTLNIREAAVVKRFTAHSLWQTLAAKLEQKPPRLK